MPRAVAQADLWVLTLVNEIDDFGEPDVLAAEQQIDPLTVRYGPLYARASKR
jgi:hypothetical protein